MHASSRTSILAALVVVPVAGFIALLSAQTGQVRTGADALAGWKVDAPGGRAVVPCGADTMTAGRQAGIG